MLLSAMKTVRQTVITQSENLRSMNSQALKSILLGIVLVVVIGGVILWLNDSYRRMKEQCERMGGSFYSISFNQNICVDGTTVYQLK